MFKINIQIFLNLGDDSASDSPSADTSQEDLSNQSKNDPVSPPQVSKQMTRSPLNSVSVAMLRSFIDH
jgi:hypothetical protein